MMSYNELEEEAARLALMDRYSEVFGVWYWSVIGDMVGEGWSKARGSQVLDEMIAACR